MRERNIQFSQAKEFLCGGKIYNNGKARINWKVLTDEFINQVFNNGISKVNSFINGLSSFRKYICLIDCLFY